jgi:septal ring factor EnvC (AmiA/AmiB activator)
MNSRLNGEINDIAQKQTLLSSNLTDKQKEMEMLRMDEKNSQSVNSELKKQETELKKRLSEREKIYNMLNDKIRDFMRSEMKNNSSSELAEKILASAKDFEDMKGFLPQPATGVIVASFGDNKVKSSYETVKLRSNRGIDILTGEKSEVYSVFKGTVRRIITTLGMLNVLIQHGSYYSVYSSLESVAVKEGDEVVARQKIGNVKNSKDGYILHFELWKNTEPVNPENWILH